MQTSQQITQLDKKGLVISTDAGIIRASTINETQELWQEKIILKWKVR